MEEQLKNELETKLTGAAIARLSHVADPRFHVRYEEYRALIGIEPLELREGQLPPRVLGLVMEWGEMHQSELMENWTTLAKEGIFRRIAPLV